MNETRTETTASLPQDVRSRTKSKGKGQDPGWVAVRVAGVLSNRSSSLLDFDVALRNIVVLEVVLDTLGLVLIYPRYANRSSG